MKLTITRVFFLAIGIAAALSHNALAQTGDAQAGKARSATCVACHAADGNSPVDQFPKIAGQVSGYIAKSLAAYKSGARANAVMMGMAATLSDEDMANLDAYFSSQSMSQGSVTEDQAEAARAGEAIYRGGIAEYSVPACMACHGPSGAGIAPNFPRLAGQHAKFIETQLLAFKSGERENPIMHPIAFPLSEQQIRQLALYVSGLSE